VLIHFDFILRASGDWTIDDVATGVQNWLICMELFPLSIAFAKTFGYQSFKEPSFNSGPRSELPMTVVSNFVNVMNVKDVLSDTKSAMKKAPKKDHKELPQFLSLPKERQQSLMIYQGYLEKKGEDIAKIWKKRFFIVLKEPSGIVVFKDDPFGIEYSNKVLKPRGWIDFKTVTAVEARRRRCFNIVTPVRVWRLRCRTPDERPQWMNLVIVTCRLKGASSTEENGTVELDED